MVNVNLTAQISTFNDEEKEIKKKYQYWEDKDWEKDALKRFVVDIVSEEGSELDHAKSITLHIISTE